MTEKTKPRDAVYQEGIDMAELLEKRLRYLKAKLQDLKRHHAAKDRPPVVELEIEAIEEQIKNLDGFDSQNETQH